MDKRGECVWGPFGRLMGRKFRANVATDLARKEFFVITMLSNLPFGEDLGQRRRAGLRRRDEGKSWYSGMFKVQTATKTWKVQLVFKSLSSRRFMRRANAIAVLIWRSFPRRSSEALNSSGPLRSVINPQVQRESRGGVFLFLLSAPTAR